MFKLTRREMLKTLAATAAASAVGTVTGTAITGCADPEDERVTEADQWFKSVCRYCGTGCGVQIGVKEGRVVTVQGDPDNPVNMGNLCTKAFFLPQAIYAEERLKTPLIKENGEFREASWDEAMELITSKYNEAIEEYGVDSVAFYGSGQKTVEEGYIANKLFKGCLGTNNIEGNPRTCMASAVAGYVTTYGRDAPMGSFSDIEHANVFFLIGTNTAEAHPIVYSRIVERKRTGEDVTVIVVDPRTTRTFEIADYGLNYTPGSAAALLNSMAYVMIQEGMHDKEFIDNHLTFKETVDQEDQDRRWEEYVQFLEDFAPEKVADTCGIPAETIVEIARVFGDPERRTMSMWTMGINQRFRGTWENNLIHNLHLITGKMRHKGSTPFSLTGQPSAMGSVRETGALTHMLPGHRVVANEEHRRETAEVWGVDPNNIQPEPGMHMMDMFEGTVDGRIKCLWVMCTNPGHSLPNVNHYREGMKKTFLVVSEAYHPTRTSELADVVLPSAFWCEKEGFFGNTERRTQHMAQAIDPPGEARSDVWVLMDFAKRMGYGPYFQHYETHEDIFNEYRKLTVGRIELAEYSDYLDETGLLWPVVDGEESKKRYSYPDDPYVTEEQGVYFYGKPEGRAWVYLRPQMPPAEEPDQEYPYWYTTMRQIEHWHTSTMTIRARELARTKSDYVEIHPEDAARERIEDGDPVTISSRRGSIRLVAKIGGRGEPKPGMLASPMHEMSRDQLVNIVVNDAVDPISKQPEYKMSAVKITRG